MGRLKGWRLWYMVSVAILCAGLSVPFVVGTLAIIDGRAEGSLPVLGMVSAAICLALMTTHVVLVVRAILPQIRRLRKNATEFPGGQPHVGSE